MLMIIHLHDCFFVENIEQKSFYDFLFVKRLQKSCGKNL